MAETQVQQSVAGSGPVLEDAWREVVFSVREARRALPYVARIARDAAHAFDDAQQCRRALLQTPGVPQRDELVQGRDAALHRLNAAIDECNTVGADLLDFSNGAVRFSALVNDRPASLLWRMGEPVETAWEDLPGSA